MEGLECSLQLIILIPWVTGRPTALLQMLTRLKQETKCSFPKSQINPPNTEMFHLHM